MKPNRCPWEGRERQDAALFGDKRRSLGIRRSIKHRPGLLLVVDSPRMAIEAATANPTGRTGPEPGVRER